MSWGCACRTRPQSKPPPPLYPSLAWHDAGKPTGQCWNSPQCFQSNCTNHLTHRWTSWMMSFYFLLFCITFLLSSPRKIGIPPHCVCRVPGKARQGRVWWNVVSSATSSPNYPSIYASSAYANASYLNGLPPLCPGCSYGLYRRGVFVPSRKPAGHTLNRKYHPKGDKDGTSLLIWLNHKAQL